MNVEAWAARWNINPEALREFYALANADKYSPKPSTELAVGSEARQQQLVRLDAADNGVWLTRNNVGAYLDARGIPVRYGLANESKLQNDAVKSADLIGMRPVLVTHAHVGTTIAQFVSREVKHAGWHYTGNKHEQAQLAWANFVNAKGGDAKFVTKSLNV